MVSRANRSNTSADIACDVLLCKQGDKPHSVVEDKAKQLKERIERLYSCECDVDFVNAKRLLGMARQRRRAALPLKVAQQLPATNAFICLVTILTLLRSSRILTGAT